MDEPPQIFHLLNQDAQQVKRTPYGSVGTVYSDEQIEAVWVMKQDEAIEPGWFQQKTVDFIVVLQGQLKVEFEKPEIADEVLDPGDLLMLPAGSRCRAYRWPRDRKEGTLFLAIYPAEK